MPRPPAPILNLLLLTLPFLLSLGLDAFYASLVQAEALPVEGLAWAIAVFFTIAWFYLFSLAVKQASLWFTRAYTAIWLLQLLTSFMLLSNMLSFVDIERSLALFFLPLARAFAEQRVSYLGLMAICIVMLFRGVVGVKLLKEQEAPGSAEERTE